MKEGREPFALSTPEYLKFEAVEEPWIIEQILPLSGSAVIYGPAKVGKSFLALQLAAAVTGEVDNWMGFKAREHGLVLYLQFDVSKAMWQHVHCEGMLEAGYVLDGVYHVDREMVTWPFNILEPESQDALRALVQHLRPLVVIVDTIRKVHLGNEDKSEVMQEVTMQLRTCCHPAAVVYVGHSRKPKEDSGNDARHELRGSGFIGGDVDTNVQCRRGGSGLDIVGRALEDQRLITARTPLLWTVRETDDKFQAQVAQVLQEKMFTTVRAKANELARVSKRPLETCRSAVRRAMMEFRTDHREEVNT